MDLDFSGKHGCVHMDGAWRRDGGGVTCTKYGGEEAFTSRNINNVLGEISKAKRRRRRRSGKEEEEERFNFRSTLRRRRRCLFSPFSCSSLVLLYTDAAHGRQFHL